MDDSRGRKTVRIAALALIASLAAGCSADERPSAGADASGPLAIDDAAGSQPEAGGPAEDADAAPSARPELDATAPDAAHQDAGADAGAHDAQLADADAGELADGETRGGPKVRPIDGGAVIRAITGGNAPMLTPAADKLSERGYVEEEFLLAGEASAYDAHGELGLDGAWKAVPMGRAPYRTRLLVRRPAVAAQFNGTVLVEWLNVTGGIDAAVGYAFGWEELLRGGYAYVGVSVQKAGVDSLKLGDGERYQELEHPGDTYAYDIFAQAGAAIGWPGALDALKGLRAERLIAYGESQSAMRMITFANAIQPLTRVFDGIMIHSRAGWGAAIGTESDALLGNGKPVRVRADLAARVLQFFTESELFLALGPAYAARQPDSERVRTWEVAGTAHADARLLGKGTDIGCGLANEGPQHFVLKAALRAMHRWLKDGVAPPMAAPLDVNAGKTKIERDVYGNALGGVRTPAVDVPVAQHSGEPTAQNSWNPSCLLFGQTLPFTAQELRALYPTHQDYVDKVTRAARSAREAGFVLPEDELTIVAEAMAAAIPE